MNYYLGLDLGTSGIKGVCFDIKGNIIDSHLEEYDIICPNPGYAEEDPLIWLNKTELVLKYFSEKDYAKNIKGLGISGQMHGLVILDEFDKPLRNSIIWCDNRTAEEAKYLTDVIGKEKLKEITKNIAIPSFTLEKLLWIKKNEPEIYNKIAKAMLPKDYIAYMLTNTYFGEYSDASGMQILDLEKLEYSKELLDKLDIDINIFPKLIKSHDIRGKLLAKYKLDAYLVGGAGDQAAGALGLGVISSNDLSISLGSSGVVYAPTDDIYLNDGEVQSFATTIYKKYHIMGVTNGCGTSLKWLRDQMFDKSYNEMMDMAEKINVGANGLIYLPYLMGERTPILDNDAKGLYIGIRPDTTKAEFIRATVEGVGYSIKDCYRLIKKEPTNVYISGGGARSKLFRTIIASMINKPVLEVNTKEAGALGVAILAMVGLGEYKSEEDAIKNIIRVENKTLPNEEWVKYYDNKFIVYKEIYESVKENFKKL